MDKVRLGRALGYGTRHAAKTLAAVAEAAAAPDPPQQSGLAQEQQAPRPQDARQSRNGQEPAATSAMGVKAQAAAARPRPLSPVASSTAPTGKAVRQAGRSALAPLATFSSALWLRVTGLFFTLIALAMASGAWRVRDGVHPSADPGTLRHFWLFSGLAALFAYFAISSFVRAAWRERR